MARPKPSRAELDLIGALRARAQRLPASGRLALGIGDDCAILRPRPAEDLVVTTDLLLENVHFRQAWHPPESVGHRALARGLSDLAAMGAKPVASFLSLALPKNLATDWYDRFLDGWMALSAEAGVPLAGGDTAEAPRIGGKPGLVTVDVVLVGSVPSGRALLRSGARAGDLLYVTGPLGGAVVELDGLRRGLRTHPAERRSRRGACRPQPHSFPQPRLKLGRRLMQNRIATAAIDLSDGLSTDLTHLCESSGVGAVVEQGATPRAAGASLFDALHGGEDYELLFTASPTRPVRSVAGTHVFPIGRMTPEAGSVKIRASDGSLSRFVAHGWEHFRGEDWFDQAGRG